MSDTECFGCFNSAAELSHLRTTARAASSHFKASTMANAPDAYEPTAEIEQSWCQWTWCPLKAGCESFGAPISDPVLRWQQRLTVVAWLGKCYTGLNREKGFGTQIAAENQNFLTNGHAKRQFKRLPSFQRRAQGHGVYVCYALFAWMYLTMRCC